MIIRISWNEDKVISIGKNIKIHVNSKNNRIRKEVENLTGKMFGDSSSTFVYIKENMCTIDISEIGYDTADCVRRIIRRLYSFRCTLNIEIDQVNDGELLYIDYISQINECITGIYFKKGEL